MTEGSHESTPPGQPRDQRTRLLDSFTHLVAQEGFAKARIGDIAARAGISRATFYELFRDKQDCFLAAQRQAAARLIATATAVQAEDDVPAVKAVIAALVGWADRESDAFILLMYESLLAGAPAAARRANLIQILEGTVEAMEDAARPSGQLPDLPVVMLLGGVLRLLALRIRRGESELTSLLADVLRWVDSYDMPAGECRWRQPTPRALLLEIHDARGVDSTTSRPLPRGRHRLPSPVVKRVQRERILQATVEVTATKGYAKMTVADIVASAGVSREVFYALFRDKREAMEDTAKMVFERLMTATASAFLDMQGPWPERVWAAGRAFADTLDASPTYAHFAFVESYSLGAGGASRLDELFMGFTMFLEEGYRHGSPTDELPRSTSEAIAGAVWETVMLAVAHDRLKQVASLRALTTYATLAPFLGPREATQLVELKEAG